MEILVSLPDIENVKGVVYVGGQLEIQYQSGAPPRFPKLEDISPDASYTARLSISSARRLVELLSQVIAHASKQR